MPSQIVLWDPDDLADSDGRIDYRYENIVNSPITAAQYLANGCRISDTYELTFTNDGGTVTVDIECGNDVKNPFQEDDVAIVADASTWNYVIPGWRFKVAVAVATGWKARFANGVIMTAAGATTDVLNEGVIEAGSNSTPQQVAAKNVGDADSVTTKIRAVPGRYYTPLEDAAEIIDYILPHTDDTREHIAVPGTYTITFDNFADGTGDKAGYKVVDVLVDGNTAITAGAMNGAEDFQYGHDDYNDGGDYLAGLRLRLKNTTDDPTALTITLVVLDGAQYVYLAPDVAGSPGSYTAGDLTLTESGQASGTIRTGQHSDFWEKWVPPDSEEPGTIRGWDYAIRGMTV